MQRLQVELVGTKRMVGAARGFRIAAQSHQERSLTWVLR